MSTALIPQADSFDPVLSTEVLAHLDVQLESARRLLAIVLDQGAAIRRRDVQTVVAQTGLMQVELQRRTMLDRDRARLLERAGLALGVAPSAVSIGLLDAIMDPQRASQAHARSAELRGMLEEIQREHHVNRALMSQELSFLDHLLRLSDADRRLGYDSAGDHNRASAPRLARRHRVLDLEV
ncbi:MAG: flagellar export chaperone FlgN [Solirubrobacteraceae bacterium]